MYENCYRVNQSQPLYQTYLFIFCIIKQLYSNMTSKKQIWYALIIRLLPAWIIFFSHILQLKKWLLLWKMYRNMNNLDTALRKYHASYRYYAHFKEPLQQNQDFWILNVYQTNISTMTQVMLILLFSN